MPGLEQFAQPAVESAAATPLACSHHPQFTSSRGRPGWQNSVTDVSNRRILGRCPEETIKGSGHCERLMRVQGPRVLGDRAINEGIV